MVVAKYNRRKAIREVIQIWAKERDHENTHFHLISNISPDGLLIEKKLPLSVGSVLFLELDMPSSDKSLTLKCRVTNNYVGEDSNIEGTGVKFLNMRHGDKKRLSALIKACRRQ